VGLNDVSKRPVGQGPVKVEGKPAHWVIGYRVWVFGTSSA
jgi:hypothetical protein